LGGTPRSDFVGGGRGDSNTCGEKEKGTGKSWGKGNYWGGGWEKNWPGLGERKKRTSVVNTIEHKGGSDFGFPVKGGKKAKKKLKRGRGVELRLSGGGKKRGGKEVRTGQFAERKKHEGFLEKRFHKAMLRENRQQWGHPTQGGRRGSLRQCFGRVTEGGRVKSGSAVGFEYAKKKGGEPRAFGQI